MRNVYFDLIDMSRSLNVAVPDIGGHISLLDEPSFIMRAVGSEWQARVARTWDRPFFWANEFLGVSMRGSISVVTPRINVVDYSRRGYTVRDFAKLYTTLRAFNSDGITYEQWTTALYGVYDGQTYQEIAERLQCLR